MKTITAIDAKNKFGQLIEAAQRQPVTITKKKPREGANIPKYGTMGEPEWPASLKAPNPTSI